MVAASHSLGRTVLALALGLSLCACQTTRTPAPDARSHVLGLLDTYAGACLDQDVHRLEGVWQMSPEARAAVERDFAKGKRISVSIRPRDIRIDDRAGTATAVFDRVEQTRSPGGVQTDAATYRARMERLGPDWKIVDLRPAAEAPAKVAVATGSANPGAKTAPARSARPAAPAKTHGAAHSRSHAAPSTDQARIVAALDAYRDAYAAQDTARLLDVWDLSRVEAFFMRQAWKRCEEVDVQISDPTVQVQGDRATADFNQELTYGCHGGKMRSIQALEARMERKPDGSWKIARFVSRKGAPPLAVSAHGSVSAETSVPAIEALYVYQSAIQSCDLDSLGQAWSMTDAERDYVQRFCEKYGGRISLSVRQENLHTDGDHGEVRFQQELTLQEGGRVRQILASLKASLVRRKGGEWTMWNLKDDVE